MKKSLQIICIFLMFLSFDTLAQESVIPEIKYADLEKYIALAKENYPRKKIFEERQNGIKTGIPISYVSFFDMFNASYFYRPDDKSVIDPINPYNFNGFQLGVNVNLGNLLQKPFMVKKAKSDFKVAQLETQEYNMQLETEVKTRYYDYILQLNQLKIATQSALDNKTVTDGLRNKFEKGEITLDAYSTARINQSASSTARIQTEINYLKAKDSLEEIIGKKLTDVK